MGISKELNLRMARIIDYDRYYIPSTDEFVDGFKYMYVSYAIGSPIPNTDSKKWETHYKEGIWGSPWGLQSIEDVKKRLNNQSHFIMSIKAKKQITTYALKDLLKEHPLRFKYDDLDLVVYPKKSVGEQHEVYVNDIYQYQLYGTDIESKWHNSGKARTPFGQDWRVLLDLNGHGVTSLVNDCLWEYFEGVETNEKPVREDFKEKEILGKATLIERKEKQRLNPKTVNLRIKRKEVVSDYVQNIRNDKQAKREQIVREIIGKLMAKREADKQIQSANLKNQLAMERLRTVYIESKLTKRRFRAPRWKADKYCTKWFIMSTKLAYKEQERLERQERKTIAVGKLEESVTTIPIYGTKRKVNKDKSPIKVDYTYGKNTKYATETGSYKKKETIVVKKKVKIGERIIKLLQLPKFNENDRKEHQHNGFSGVNRKARRADEQKERYNNPFIKRQVVKTVPDIVEITEVEKPIGRIPAIHRSKSPLYDPSIPITENYGRKTKKVKVITTKRPVEEHIVQWYEPIYWWRVYHPKSNKTGKFLTFEPMLIRVFENLEVKTKTIIREVPTFYRSLVTLAFPSDKGKKLGNYKKAIEEIKIEKNGKKSNG